MPSDIVEVVDPESLPVHERVHRALRARILDGAMAPGETLTLRGLAGQLSVSMTPAREAVRRLVAERALTMTPSGRIRVPDPDAGTLADLFRARTLLEPDLARRALPRVTPDRLTRMHALDTEIERHLGAGRAGAYVAANHRFHTTLYQPAEAPALMALVESVWLQTAPAMRRLYSRVGTGGLADHHATALDAIATGDADRLVGAIEADIAQGAALLLRRS